VRVSRDNIGRGRGREGRGSSSSQACFYPRRYPIAAEQCTQPFNLLTASQVASGVSTAITNLTRPSRPRHSYDRQAMRKSGEDIVEWTWYGMPCETLIHVHELIADEQAAILHRASIINDRPCSSYSPQFASAVVSELPRSEVPEDLRDAGDGQQQTKHESLQEKALRFATLAEKTNILLHEKYSRHQRMGVGFGSKSRRDRELETAKNTDLSSFREHLSIFSSDGVLVGEVECEGLVLRPSARSSSMLDHLNASLPLDQQPEVLLEAHAHDSPPDLFTDSLSIASPSSTQASADRSAIAQEKDDEAPEQDVTEQEVFDVDATTAVSELGVSDGKMEHRKESDIDYEEVDDDMANSAEESDDEDDLTLNELAMLDDDDDDGDDDDDDDDDDGDGEAEDDHVLDDEYNDDEEEEEEEYEDKSASGDDSDEVSEGEVSDETEALILQERVRDDRASSHSSSVVSSFASQQKAFIRSQVVPDHEADFLSFDTVSSRATNRKPRREIVEFESDCSLDEDTLMDYLNNVCDDEQDEDGLQQFAEAFSFVTGNADSDLEYDLRFENHDSESDTSEEDDEEVSFVRDGSDSDSSQGPASVFDEGFEPWWNDPNEDAPLCSELLAEHVAASISSAGAVGSEATKLTTGRERERKKGRDGVVDDLHFAARASGDFSSSVFRDREFPTPPANYKGYMLKRLHRVLDDDSSGDDSPQNSLPRSVAPPSFQKRLTKQGGRVQKMGRKASRSAKLTKRQVKLERKKDRRRKHQQDKQSKQYERLLSVHGLLKDFVAITSNDVESLALPPMNRTLRALVHQLARIYQVNSRSTGGGARRFTILYKDQNSTSPDAVKLDKFFRHAEVALLVGDSDQDDFDDLDVSSSRSRARTKKKEKHGPSRLHENSKRFLANRSVGEGAKPIHQSNVGNKLLRTLGWSGGGLGKDENGIVAPISMRIKTDKCGLGF